MQECCSRTEAVVRESRRVDGGDTMTFRETLDVRMPVGVFIAVVAFVAVLGVLLGVLEHHYCTTAPSEVARPDFGTPRYNWCRSHDDTYRWSLAIAPAALVALVGVASRLRLVVTLGIAVVLLIAGAAVATYPSKLDYAPLVNAVPPT
jgi:hypothetical protein